MLRGLVLVLLVANLLFFAWARGALDQVVGVRADGDREPARLGLQVDPEVIRILSPQPFVPPSPPQAPQALSVVPAPVASGASSAVAVSADATCLEAGPFLSTQVGTAEAALQAVLPTNRWTSLRTEQPAVWVVYMGRYTDREARLKKIEELRRLDVAAEELRGVPELGDGLSLGRHADRASAEKALAELNQRGVRTARVVQLSPPTIGYMLRVDGSNVGNHRGEPGLQARLNSLQGIVLMGHPFKACGSGAGDSPG